MKPIIRAAALDDVRAVARLFRHSFDPELHPYLTQAQHGASRFMALPFRYPQLYAGHEMLVAMHGDDLVGVADFRRSSPGDGFLSYLFIAEEARGHGLATALIRFFLDKTSVKTLALDVFTSNGPANALYDKFGFSTGPQNSWLARDLPRATSPEGIQDFASQDASHKTYGFSQFTTDGSHFTAANFGHIGDSVLKCFSADTFEDDDVLGRLHASLPECSEAFAVVSGERNTAVPHRFLVRSERRTLAAR